MSLESDHWLAARARHASDEAVGAADQEGRAPALVAPGAQPGREIRGAPRLAADLQRHHVLVGAECCEQRLALLGHRARALAARHRDLAQFHREIARHALVVLGESRLHPGRHARAHRENAQARRHQRVSGISDQSFSMA